MASLAEEKQRIKNMTKQKKLALKHWMVRKREDGKFARGGSIGNLTSIAIDSKYVTRNEMTYRRGEHSLAKWRIQQKILREEGEDADRTRYRVWQGILYEHPDFENLLVEMFVNPYDAHFCAQNSHEIREYIQNMKRVDEYFQKKGVKLYIILF